MSKIAYLECPTGVAGDMCLGAIVDAGVPLEYLTESLARLGISHEYHLRSQPVRHNGQQATKVHVDLCLETSATPAPTSDPVAIVHDYVPNHSHPAPTHETAALHTHSHFHASHAHPDGQTHSHPHTTYPIRHLPEIEQLILSAQLPTRSQAWSLAVFRTLAAAEGAVHGIPPEQVHFHEVGATDAIVDIVGTCLGLDWLGIDKLYCSALPTGGGTVRAAHGRLPVPVPAVLKLWEMRQIPLYSNGIERELVTPTGAAIVTTLATQFGPPPSMTLLRVGLGAGTQTLPIPNILRLWLGARNGLGEIHQDHQAVIAPAVSSGTETIATLETQIDDLNPQAIGYLFEALFAVGALDVFTQAIGMKKSRPGILLTVVCQAEQVAACEQVIFRETTTLGIRHLRQQRRILQREIQSVQTKYGPVRVKVAWNTSADEPLNVQPEYEDCAQIARQQQLPWREVHRVALQSWHSH
jgi:uncharacterized protein (TIGR00299 family) protein